MTLFKKQITVFTAMLLLGGMAFSQIPVEVLTGNKKTTLDVLFFKNFKSNNQTNSRFLFFNRNRTTIDYKMTSTSNLPQFGFTEAISYNYEKLYGFSPVLVCQIIGSGFYTKTGVQFARIRKGLMLFTWIVSEIQKQPTIDLFFLGRYTPKITDKLNFFSQIELLNAFPSNSQKEYTFTQRVRLGLKIREFQFGVASDFSEIGRTEFNHTNNTGVFLRYEY